MEEDLSLLRSCLAGDERARDAFVGRFAPAVFGAVRRALGGEPQDPSLSAEDLAQEVFLRLFKDGARLLRNFDPARASLKTWLCVVARSTAVDFARRKRAPTVSFEPGLHDPAGGRAGSESEGIELPPGLLSGKQALVMHMLFEKGWDVREAARVLGVSEQTVRSMKHKAIEKLRPLLVEKAARKD